MAHATQMAAARQGILTPQMRQVLADEKIHEADLLERVANGRIAIPANHNHKSLIAKGIGAGLTTKINVNLGTSTGKADVIMPAHTQRMDRREKMTARRSSAAPAQATGYLVDA